MADERFIRYVGKSGEAFYDNIQGTQVSKEVVERHLYTKYTKEISEKDRIIDFLVEMIKEYNESCVDGFEIKSEDLNIIKKEL